jgi:hypothetical protein
MEQSKAFAASFDSKVLLQGAILCGKGYPVCVAWLLAAGIATA